MTGIAREGEGAAGDEPQPIPEEIEQIMRKARRDPEQQGSLTREEAQKLVQWNRDHPMALQRPEPTLEVVAADEIWHADARGGPLFAAWRLLWWLYHCPEAVGDREQYFSIVHEFERRIGWFDTGWTDQEGFADPAFEPARVRTLDDAFHEAKKGREDLAGNPALRPHALGASCAWRLWGAVRTWMAEHPDKATLESAWEALAGSEEFPGESVATLKRWYYDVYHVLEDSQNRAKN